MRISHHPDDATILAYAAGTLGEGFSLVLAAHFEKCAGCSRRVRDAVAVGGALIAALPPAEMSTAVPGPVWKRIDKAPRPEPPVTHPMSRGGLPAVLMPFVGDHFEQVQWRTLVAGIRQCVLKGVESGRGSVRLLSIAPGTGIPRHTHRGGELTLVLKGAYRDQTGRFQSGDLADLDPSVEHQPVVDGGEPCICLIATDDKLRFRGTLSRLLQPLLGI